MKKKVSSFTVVNLSNYLKHRMFHNSKSIKEKINKHTKINSKFNLKCVQSFRFCVALISEDAIFTVTSSSAVTSSFESHSLEFLDMPPEDVL